MATVTPPPGSLFGDADRAAVDRRVRNPLEQMRGTIRLYVAAEGLAVLGIYLALWCWITLALDYGLFQAASVDWTQGVPSRAIRALLLGGLFAFVLALVGLFRAGGSATRQPGQSRRATFQGITLLVGMVLMLAAPLVYFVLQGQNQLVALLMLAFHLLVMTLVLVFAIVRILHAGRSPVWLAVGAALGFGYVICWLLVGSLRDLNVVGGPGAAALLILLAAAPVAYVVARMLTTIFSDVSLALVLERRFPRQLGDRLITAVELSDPRIAGRYGYSQAMIDRTITEAAEEVGKLPVKEVFDWNRLARYGVFVVGLTAGMYLLALAGYWAMHAKPGVVSEFTGRSENLASIWFERNVLLGNTPWPRQAQLELIGFPEKGDLRVGRTAASPAIRVRALRWVIADDESRDGWRALRWHDLTPALLGGKPVPELPPILVAAPAKAGAEGSAAPTVPLQVALAPSDWTVDQVQVQLPSESWLAAVGGQTAVARAVGVGAAPPTGGVSAPVHLVDPLVPTAGAFQVNPQTIPKLLAVHRALQSLAATAAQPTMQRTLRLLDVPDEVKLYYSGRNISNEITLKRESGNDYVGELVNLPESVSFQAKARNYSTPSYTITVVPPPVLVDLVQADARPAYLYHPAFLNADGKLQDPAVLRGRRQTPPAEKVSLTGDTSPVTVPAGTSVTLTGQVAWLEKDRDLQKQAEAAKQLIEVKVTPRKGQVEGLPATAKLRADNRTFDLVLPTVTKSFDFELQFVDNDDIVGRRLIHVEAERDRNPEVNLQVDSIIRKTGAGNFMITAFAKVPFVGEVTDDHGLQKLDYVYTLAAVDSATAVGVKAQYAALTLGLTPIATPSSAHLLARLAVTESEPAPQTAPFLSFREALARVNAGAVPEPEFRALLKKRPSDLPGLLTRFLVQKPEGLDLKELGVKDKDDTGVPVRYRLRVWGVAADNNVETGPNVGESKERFTFQVVPVQELLSEIDKEEEAMRIKLDQAVRLVRDARNEKFKDALRELEDAKETQKAKDDPEYGKKFYRAMSSQVSRVGEQVNSAETSVKEIASDYEKILAELQANLRESFGPDGQPDHEMITRVRGIKRAFDALLAGDGPFAVSSRSLLELQEGLEAQKNNPGSIAIARDRLDQLITRLEDLLKMLGDLTTFNKVLENAYKLKMTQLEINRDIVAERDRLEKAFLEQLLDPKK